MISSLPLNMIKKQGENLIETSGAISHLTREKLDEIAIKLPFAPINPMILAMIGGHNKVFKLERENLALLEDLVNQRKGWHATGGYFLSQHQGAPLMI